MTFLRGFPLYLATCAVTAALMVIPPDLARWVALGLLCVLVLSPAVGRRVR